MGEVDAFGVPVSFVNAAVLALQFNGLGVLCCTVICFEQPKVRPELNGKEKQKGRKSSSNAVLVICCLFVSLPAISLPSHSVHTPLFWMRVRVSTSRSLLYSRLFPDDFFRGLWGGGLVFVCVHCHDELGGDGVGAPAQSTLRDCLLHPPHAPLRYASAFIEGEAQIAGCTCMV